MLIVLAILNVIIAVACVYFAFRNLTLYRAHRELVARYNLLFCEEPECNRLKYFKFKYCTEHLSDGGSAGDLDPPEMERPHS